MGVSKTDTHSQLLTVFLLNLTAGFKLYWQTYKTSIREGVINIKAAGTRDIRIFFVPNVVRAPEFLEL